MTRSNIPPEIRRCAMWCHLIHLSWIIISGLGFWATASMSGPNDIDAGYLVVLIIIFLPPVALFGSTLLAWIYWRLNYQRHPFINDSGKEAMNFALSIDLYVLIVGTIVFTSCGLMAIGLQGAGGAALISALVPLLLLFQAILVLLGGIQALLGIMYIYPLKIQFIQ